MINGKLKKAYEFLSMAQDELSLYEKEKKEEVLQQACEKGWGAVAQALKVVNPDIKRHAEFGRIALRLAQEYKNEEIFHGEAMGEHLHRAGFYEGHLSKEEAKHGIMCVENFLKLIDNILNNGGGKRL